MKIRVLMLKLSSDMWKQRRELSFLYMTSKHRNGDLSSTCEEKFEHHGPELEGDMKKEMALGLCLPHTVLFPILSVSSTCGLVMRVNPRKSLSSRAPHIQAGWCWPVASPLSLNHKMEKQGHLQRIVVRTKWEKALKVARVTGSVKSNSVVYLLWNKAQKWQLSIL